ncbi:MAG TPA: MBL fold metallo-hydrolase [Noviherbaspirillum sp.]|jgi:L-ascorbate metabolism protein UlaG (beta-lactamase superfamily)|uniref:MBL fold metallo-hydrolase n=1 Tax=Noviherbaspirillum sp. TaxID=1926288 RepID=UPI002F954706
MKLARRLGGALVLVLMLAAAYVVVLANRRPSLAPYQERVLAAAPDSAPVRVRFAGVSTLLFDDGETAFMTDGFFSRPGILRTLFATISPDTAAIGHGLGQLRVSRLAAVVVLHGHYDHALDAPEVAARTGGLLVGDASTLNLGRGYGLAEARMRSVAANDSLALGRWTLTFLPSRHAPTPFSDGGTRERIDTPLRPPARAGAWREGETWSLLVRHASGQSFLVQGSAGYLEGALKGHRAGVVFLGVGGAGKQSQAYRARLWEETVKTVGAHRVIPVHWDDFSQPLERPLRALPYLADDLGATMADLLAFGAAGKVEVRMPPLFVPFAPD